MCSFLFVEIYIGGDNAISENIKIQPRSSIGNKTKRTTDEYKHELLNLNPNIVVLEEYITANTKILHRCNKHNVTFYAYPTNILRGCGCKECGKEKISLKNTISEEDFKIRLEEYFGKDIFLLGKYINLNTTTTFGCSNGHTWDTQPRCLFNMKHGCFECSVQRNSDKLRKTIDEYKLEASIKNPNVTVIDNEYVNNSTALLHKCNKCGYEWMALPSNILKGHGCKKCATKLASSNKIKSHDQFMKNFILNNPHSNNIEIVSKYSGSHDKINCRCKICNHEWNSLATNLLKGSGCPCCNNKFMSDFHKKPQEQYIQEISKFNIKLLDTYISSRTNVLHQCLLCGFTWSVRPNNILTQKCKCPNCCVVKSRGESLVKTYLNECNIDYITTQKYDDLRGIKNGLLSYDFYIPLYNLLIEFQGIQHERPVEYFGGKEQFKIQQEHDRRKHEYAKSHNIYLLEIWYYDIDNTVNILKETLNNLKLESLTTAG